MVKFTNKFVYKDLDRQDTEQGRYYLIDNKKLPSVTTILKATETKEKKEKLQNWKKRVGLQEANRISTEARNVGKLMHEDLEQKLKYNTRIKGENLIHQISRKMSDKIYENLVKNLSEIWGMECKLFYPDLYSGTADLIGIWKSRPTVIDFKQANKPKKKEWITDYFCQGCLYSAAHNITYGTNIQSIAIFVCVRNTNYDFQLFEIEGDEYKHYMEIAGKRVEEFYKI